MAFCICGVWDEMGDAETCVRNDSVLEEETKLVAEQGLECDSIMSHIEILEGKNRRTFELHELSIERLKAAFIGTLSSWLILDESQFL